MSELIQINALAPLQGVRKTSKVMLLFPPEWVPTAPYLAMPSLTAVLREIFDESAYARFLRRHHLASSRESYAAFLKESAVAKSRRAKCC